MKRTHDKNPKQTEGTVTANIIGTGIPAKIFSGDPDRMQMYRNEGRLTIFATKDDASITAHSFHIEVPGDLPADGKDYTYKVVGGEASGFYLDYQNSTAEFYTFFNGEITVQLNGDDRLQGTFKFEGKHGEMKTVTVTEGSIDLTGFMTPSKAVKAGTGTFNGTLTGGPAAGEFTSSTVNLSAEGGGPISEFWLVQGIHKDANNPFMNNFINILIDKDQTAMVYDLTNNKKTRATFNNAQYGVASTISGELIFSSLPINGRATGKLKCSVQKNQEAAFNIEANFDVSRSLVK